MNELTKKYGTEGISLILEKAADSLESGDKWEKDKVLLLKNLAEDLREALSDW